MAAKLIDGGDILHIEGGERGPAGCYYQISGPDGLAAALAMCEGMSDVCPVWLACFKVGVKPPMLHNACDNQSHEPGSEAHPDWHPRDVQYWTHDIKMADFRVWWDCSNGSCNWSAPGAGYKGKGKGAGKGKLGKGKGKGKGKAGKGGKSS